MNLALREIDQHIKDDTLYPFLYGWLKSRVMLLHNLSDVQLLKEDVLKIREFLKQNSL